MAKGRDGKTSLCFVIGPIGKDGTPERKHADLLLNSVIKEVLEKDEFGYQVKRADEDADPGMIGDRVITDITQADLVMADLTDLNPNAFYELGIRHSTEKPTIHLARAGTVLPFDNVSHRTIFIDLTDWQSTLQARTRLADSTRAINAPGYKVSNPITQANASFKMRESADPRDRVIAELQERLAKIESDQRQPARISEGKLTNETRFLIYALVRSAKSRGLSMKEAALEILDKVNGVTAVSQNDKFDPKELQVFFSDGASLTVRWPEEENLKH